MRKLLCGALLLVGCFDWESLSTRYGEAPGEPDLLGTTGSDDLGAPADLESSQADLRTPPDMSTPLTWTKEQAAPTPATALNSIFGAGTGANLTVWAVGDGGQALKYNPANKTWSATAVGPLTDSYRDVWLKDDNSTGWIVGSGAAGAAAAYRWTGTAWMPDAAGLSMTQQAVWGNAGNLVLTGGASTTSVFLYTTAWAAKSNAAGRVLSGAWGAGMRFWLMGTNNDALYVENNTFSAKSACGQGATVFSSVWGFGATDAWAAGDSGFICRWDATGLVWSRQAQVSGAPNFNGIWGSSTKDIWAVADSGTVAHYDGSGWTRLTPAQLSGRNLRAVWGADAMNVWVVSDKGEIFRAY